MPVGGGGMNAVTDNAEPALTAEEMLRQEIAADAAVANPEPANLFGDPLRDPTGRREEVLRTMRSGLRDITSLSDNDRLYVEMLLDGAVGKLTEGVVLATAEETVGAEAPPELEPDPVADYETVAPSITVPLSHPFTIEGQPITEVSIRPPSYGLVERATKGKTTRIEVYSAMTGLSPAALRAMRWPDAERVFGAATDLIPEFARGI